MRLCNRIETKQLVERSARTLCHQQFLEIVGKQTFSRMEQALGYTDSFRMKEDYSVQYHVSTDQRGEPISLVVHYGTAYVCPEKLHVSA